VTAITFTYDVHLDHFNLAIDVRLQKFASEPEPGVVDEYSDFDALSDCCSVDLRGSVGLAEISWNHSGSHVVFPFDHSRCGFESVLAARDENQIVAVPGAFFRQLETDTA